MDHYSDYDNKKRQDINENTLIETFNITRSRYTFQTVELVEKISKKETKDYHDIEKEKRH